MDGREYVRQVAEERFGAPAMTEPEADRPAPELLYPTCPVCGYQVTHMGRHKAMRWHKERRVGPDGRMYTADADCPGTGELPELMPAWPTARGR